MNKGCQAAFDRSNLHHGRRGGASAGAHAQIQEARNKTMPFIPRKLQVCWKLFGSVEKRAGARCHHRTDQIGGRKGECGVCNGVSWQNRRSGRAESVYRSARTLRASGRMHSKRTGFGRGVATAPPGGSGICVLVQGQSAEPSGRTGSVRSLIVAFLKCVSWGRVRLPRAGALEECTHCSSQRHGI